MLEGGLRLGGGCGLGGREEVGEGGRGRWTCGEAGGEKRSGEREKGRTARVVRIGFRRRAGEGRTEMWYGIPPDSTNVLSPGTARNPFPQFAHEKHA